MLASSGITEVSLGASSFLASLSLSLWTCGSYNRHISEKLYFMAAHFNVAMLISSSFLQPIILNQLTGKIHDSDKVPFPYSSCWLPGIHLTLPILFCITKGRVWHPMTDLQYNWLLLLHDYTQHDTIYIQIIPAGFFLLLYANLLKTAKKPLPKLQSTNILYKCLSSVLR